MALQRPFRRTVRQTTYGDFTSSGSLAYVLHPKYAKDPLLFIRSAALIQKELFDIFEYVEPDDKNLHIHSLRILNLLIRICVDIEANLTAILKENGYQKSGNWSMVDYRKIEDSHFLSRFEVSFPSWSGQPRAIRPFASWGLPERSSPSWYKAYNSTKHDRHGSYYEASLEKVVDAFAGLIVLLSAQFWTEDYLSVHVLSLEGRPMDGYSVALGGVVWVRFDGKLEDGDVYGFNWSAISDDDDPFVNFPYR